MFLSDQRDWREIAKENDEKCIDVRGLAELIREAAKADPPCQPR
ncbi:hypothetical protein [Kibdelosporangium aridum]|nr:hypothetical protein [Kibdelosporangium aridum]